MGGTAHLLGHKNTLTRQIRLRRNLDRLAAGRSEDAGEGGEILRVLSRYKSGERRLKAGEDLVTLGEPTQAVYILKYGWAFTFSPLADGRQLILRFAVATAVLDFQPGSNAVASYGVRALTDAIIDVISHGDLISLFRDNPAVGISLTTLLSRDRNLAFDQLTAICRFSARQRVGRLLLQLAIHSHLQTRASRTKEMFLPLTQEHLGDATGLSSVHVNRILRGLRNDGIVEFHYRRLKILDLEKLLELAGSDEVNPRRAASV